MISPTVERRDELVTEMVEWEPSAQLLMALRLAYAAMLQTGSNLLDAHSPETTVYILVGRGKGAEAIMMKAAELQKLHDPHLPHGGSGRTPLSVPKTNAN